ncbi:MAG: hypothetical protein ACLFTT_02660 [Candidatus Hydrogenedentota bacterium]
MAHHEERAAKRDEMRLCPVCRMSISVLATKCRYCGEEVHRPRKKEANLTIDDLGGQQTSQYRPSGNVVEAIEAFRAEVLNQGGGQQAGTGYAGGAGDSMPELDAHSREMLNAVMGTDSPPAPQATPPVKPKQAGLNLPPWALWCILALAALGLLIAGVRVASSVMYPQQANESTVINRAPQMMQQGQPPLAVLQEAQAALDTNFNAENRAIAEEARAYLAQRVNELLLAVPWERDMLDQASRLTTQALEISTDPALRALRQKVLEEVTAYSLHLEVDAAAKTVHLRHKDPGVPDETVGEGDMLAGRFEVLRISEYQVRLEDHKVQGPIGPRRLIYWVQDGRLTGL